MERTVMLREFQEQRELNRAIVRSLFDTNEWISKPIVVCNFALLFEPSTSAILEESIPVEVGLAAFSFKDGIIDNYGRLIDPGNDIPADKREDALSAVKQMGHPDLGTCEELKLYETLHSNITSFLTKHTEELQEDDFVFALSRDLEKVTRCLEWVSKVACKPLQVKILDLSFWAHLASTENNKEYRQASDLDLGNPLSLRMSQPLMAGAVNRLIKTSVLKLPTSSNRVVGKPLTSAFAYPIQHPFVKHGVFLVETLVDDIIGKGDNYKGYDELCCMYHMKGGDGVHACALNLCNRYIYSLLDILTLSNKVEIRGGAHFPIIHSLPVEREHRIFLLMRWGFTELELQMKDEYSKRRSEREAERRQKLIHDEHGDENSLKNILESLGTILRARPLGHNFT